jgi:hypothetical protein
VTTEEVVVIAMRALGQCSVPGSRIRHCKDCGFAVWVAPSSPPDAKAICNQCAVDLLPWGDPDMKIMDQTPEQTAELADYFGKKRS